MAISYFSHWAVAIIPAAPTYIPHNSNSQQPFYRQLVNPFSSAAAAATKITPTDIMASKPRISKPTASTLRLTRKSLANSTRRFNKPRDSCHRRAVLLGGASFSVSEKLEALKSLIPFDTAEIKPDQLYEETADYIVLLKSQVFVLQKLIDFYGSQPQQNPNVV